MTRQVILVFYRHVNSLPNDVGNLSGAKSYDIGHAVICKIGFLTGWLLRQPLETYIIGADQGVKTSVTMVIFRAAIHFLYGGRCLYARLGSESASSKTSPE